MNSSDRDGRDGLFIVRNKELESASNSKSDGLFYLR